MPIADHPNMPQDQRHSQRVLTALAFDTAKPQGARPTATELTRYCEQQLTIARRTEVKSWIAREPEIFEAFVRLAENIEVVEAPRKTEPSIADARPGVDAVSNMTPWWRKPGWLTGGLIGALATAALVAFLLPQRWHQTDNALQGIQLALNEAYRQAENNGIHWQSGRPPFKTKSLDNLLGGAEPESQPVDEQRRSFRAGMRHALSEHRGALSASDQKSIDALPSERIHCADRSCDQREALLFELGRWAILTHSICATHASPPRSMNTLTLYNKILSQLKAIALPGWLNGFAYPATSQNQACQTAAKLTGNNFD